jgi:chromosome segregation ATPase
MEEFVTLIQGPAAATVLMGAILYTAYKFVLEYVIPRIDAALKESNERYKEMLTEHKADREAWLQSIDKISERIDRMSEVTDDMAKTVENLHRSVAGITQQLQNERKV